MDFRLPSASVPHCAVTKRKKKPAETLGSAEDRVDPAGEGIGLVLLHDLVGAVPVAAKRGVDGGGQLGAGHATGISSLKSWIAGNSVTLRAGWLVSGRSTAHRCRMP